MGNFSSTAKAPPQEVAPAEPIKLLMIGLSFAGKTTILRKLNKHGESVDTSIPTIGFNVKSLHLSGTIVTAWNVGGRSRIRPLAQQYYKEADGIIFVLDSSDSPSWQMIYAEDQLDRALGEEDLAGKPLLVLANKQDKSNAMSPSEVSKRFELAEKCKDRKWNVLGCTATQGKGIDDGLNWLSSCIKENIVVKCKDDDSNVTEETDEILSENSSDDEIDEEKYDPTDAGGNLTLEHFRAIKNTTECPFAKAATLWGGYPAIDGSTLEEQAEANVVSLTEFVNRSNAGDKVDGFCIELNDPKAVTGGPKEFGECVRRVLKTLSDHDPAGEAMMSKNYIASRGWRFRFHKADFFVTTFAPCYPPTSSRYAFGTGRAFLLLQPEASFARHKLPPDTPETKWDAPKTIRDKTRVAFRQAGREYYIPETTQYPPAEHIVKPLCDDGSSVVTWWK